jgi:sugar/nucleoside kinase (ribokinase family)
MICVQGIEFAMRDGSNGSQVNGLAIPPATLKTADGKPLNPTGAGNAYSGAYAACRASGSSVEEAASLANAVGAVVCEYENLPPWTWHVLDRVVEAAFEVSSKIGT